MSLQHKITGKPKAQESPWYHNLEVAQSIQKPGVECPSILVATQESLFEPTVAKQILARASALQEIYDQLLSQEQLEAIAAEVGIKPEFVRLAIEQEKAGILSESPTAITRKVIPASTSQSRPFTKFRMAVTVGGCGLVAAAYTAADFYSVSGPGLILPVLALPLLTSLALGSLGQSRRWGAISGLAIATIIMITLLAQWLLQGVVLNSVIFSIFSIAIACNTLAGVTGAQMRRIVSKRQTSNRNRNNRVIHSA